MRTTTTESCLARLLIGLAPPLLAAGCSGGGGGAEEAAAPGAPDPDAPALMYVLTGDDRLQLFDPGQPNSAGNPLTVDTALPEQHPGSPELKDSHGVVGVGIADYDSTSGGRTNLRAARLAYAKGGNVFAVNTLRGASHAPTRISSIADACRVLQVAADNADVDRSWVLVQGAGPDRDCTERETADNTVTAIRLRALTSDGGTALPAPFVLLGNLQDAGGRIVGFLTEEGRPFPDFPGYSIYSLQRRDADLANPVVLMDNVTPGINAVRKGNSLFYLLLQPFDANGLTLYRYSVAAQTLTPLHNFTGNFPSPFVVYDADNIYFSDSTLDYSTSPARASGTIYRLAHDAVTATALTRSTDRLLYPAPPTGDRVIIYALSPSAPAGSVLSVPKAATGATPTTLLSVADGYPAVWHSDPAGLVYINVVSLDTDSVAAVRVADDGSGMASVSDAGWIHGALAPDSNSEMRQMGLASLIRIQAIPGGAVLEAFDPATGLATVALGSVANGSVTSDLVSFSSVAADRYEPLGVQVRRSDGTVDMDAFVVDLQATNSLRAIATAPGQSDSIFGGGGH